MNFLNNPYYLDFKYFYTEILLFLFLWTFEAPLYLLSSYLAQAAGHLLSNAKAQNFSESVFPLTDMFLVEEKHPPKKLE